MILVCDLTNETTFETIEEWCAQVVDIKPMPLIIVGNKVDKPNHKVKLE
jgi:GTPase SAR1 family protein